MTASYEHRSIWGHLMKLAFRQNYVDASGIRTRYAQAGSPDALPLIMIHGMGSSWECFCATLESHSEHFNCLAIDLAGSGFSDRPDEPYEIGFYVNHVLAFIQAIAIDKASFIGVSLGAWVLSRLVVDHPDKGERMTLLASSSLIINLATLARTKGDRNAAVDDPSWENIKPAFHSILFKESDRLPDLIQVRQAIYREPDMKMAMKNIPRAPGRRGAATQSRHRGGVARRLRADLHHPRARRQSGLHHDRRTHRRADGRRADPDHSGRRTWHFFANRNTPDFSYCNRVTQKVIATPSHRGKLCQTVSKRS